MSTKKRQELYRRRTARHAKPILRLELLEDRTMLAAATWMVDLPGSQLGAFMPGLLLIDGDAAGYGWFIDSTVGPSGEFAQRIAASERHAAGNSAAVGHVDLLTVIAHEIGHSLALDAELFSSSAHLRFAAPLSGRANWLNGVNDFFANGGLG